MTDKESNKIISEVVIQTMTSLSLVYAKAYQNNPKNFIGCFLKFAGIRSACAWIVWSYKKCGAFQECEGDFTEWANKQKVEEKWKRVLAEILLIIYSIIYP